jgi:UDP-glucose 4-epimerase
LEIPDQVRNDVKDVRNDGEDVRNDDSRLTFIEGDIWDRDLLRAVFARFEIKAVIHFAGLKAVGESLAFAITMGSQS